MKTACDLNDTYGFWDALVQYDRAELPQPGPAGEDPDELLAGLDAVAVMLADLQDGFAALQALSRTPPRQEREQAHVWTLVGAETDRARREIEALQAGEDRLPCGDILRITLEHWACLGDLIEAHVG